MIPGQIIALLTFPGVILHEFAHKKFCDWFNVKVFDVKYFTAEGGGHVIHERTENYNAIFWISIGPFIINTLVAFLFAIFIATINDPEGFLYLFFGWLSISFAVHSFPSNQDVSNILEESKKVLKKDGNFLHYLTYPLVVLVQIANLLRFFWIDFIWAFAIIGLALSIAGPGEAATGINSNNNRDLFPSKTSTSNGETIILGDYSCFTNHYNKALSLFPNDSLEEIDSVGDNLVYRSEELDKTYSSPENSLVSEYSPQWQIDDYNETLEYYNYEIDSYNFDYDEYERRLKLYNSEVDIYNNYLETNCTRI